MGKRKTRGRSSIANSKEHTPQISENDSSPEPPPKKKRSGPQSSATLCAEYNVQDVELEYTDADYQNLTTYNLFVRLIRPQIAAANPKFIPASKMNQIMEAKWREFTESNPFSKDSKEEEDEEEDDDKVDNNEDTEKENGDDEGKSEGSNTDDYDRSAGSDESGPTSRKSKSKANSSHSTSSDESGPSVRKTKNKGGRKSMGSLKIKLPMSFGIRKSTREKKAPKKIDDVEKFFETEEDSQEDETKKRKSRKKKLSSDEDFESDESAQKKSKRRNSSRGSTKKKKESSDSSSSGSSSSSESDSDSSDGGKRRTRKPTKKEEAKLVIPGERRSERSRRSNADSLKEMTDREFEKMLRKQDEKQQKKKRKAEKKKKKIYNSWRIKGKKGAWQNKKQVVNSGDESDHCWFCEICKDGGDLLLCDGCPKSFHQKCLKIEQIPDGEWKCPVCTGDGLPEVSEEEEEDGGHDHYCKECKEGGDLLLCDFCPGAYHMNCVNPPLEVIPEGEWKCPRCVIAENPLKQTVARILTWRWVNVSCSKEDELDHTMSPKKKSQIESSQINGEDQKGDNRKRPEREIFVKYRYHSYWDCDWIPEIALEVHQRTTWYNFKKKWDQDEPPALDDGGTVSKHHKKNENPYNLNERYYRWGVKPDWLQIHRIVSHEKESSKLNKYLVKWRELPYEEATFEAEDDLPKGLQDWKKHVEHYWSVRKEKEVREKASKKEKKDKPKKKEWKKKIEKQPAYLDETGGKLHPYQLEGFNWMRFSWAQDTNIILADEMGLGKTIQAIAFLRALFKEGYAPGPFIISAPLSTVPNWEREFEFWAPDMYVVTYIGSKENRTIIRERDFCYKEGCFAHIATPSRFREGFTPKFDVLLTSYEMVNVDKVTLASIPYSVLVIDEAHRLKRQQSLFFRNMSEYKISYKLLLTGTPLQNTLDELFSLLTFLEPEKFDDMDTFLNQFQDIGKEEQVKHLHDLLAPHMLRRLKMDVLKDLPDKCELIVRIELSPLQKKFYKHILTKNFTALNVKGHSNQTSLMNIMMDLRKCSNHPYLFPAADQDAPVGRSGMYEGSALTKASGKMELLQKMLKALKQDGHRVLIFSQMTRVLDLLEDFLDYHKHNYERIDGSVTGGLRQERIDRFNDPESSAFVFLLSTRAGGLGINLATADTVIIYDMDWNPHNDIQALSRAHRIGQKNKVMIYRFVCRDTVEEKMTQVCKSKMMLSELVIAKGGAVAAGPSGEKKESLSKQEVNAILKFGAENLFKDTEEGQVIYDEEAVEKLIDRTQAGEAEKQFGMNEYLRSFNVATYKIKEGVEEEEEEEAAPEEEPAVPSKSNISVATDIADDDPSYWARVLGDSYADHLQQLEKEQAEIAKSLGKGKRIRKQINYAETALMSFMSEKDKKKMMNVEVLEEDEDNDEQYMSDYNPNESSSSSEDEAETFDHLLDPDEKKIAEAARKNKLFIKEQKELKKQREKMKAEQNKNKVVETLPPLLAKVNGQIEVLGYTARQRRAFLDAVMKFGMPPEDVYRSHWLARDLRMKTERVFKAYMSLFMRHLCEPIPEDADKFADGVPREGLSRQHVLTRIGMIALIRRKVSEYEKFNGTNSMSEFKKTPQLGAVKGSRSILKDTLIQSSKDQKSNQIQNTADDKQEKDEINDEHSDSSKVDTEKNTDISEKEREKNSNSDDKETEKTSNSDDKETEKTSNSDDKETEKNSNSDDKETEKNSYCGSHVTEKPSNSRDEETKKDTDTLDKKGEKQADSGVIDVEKSSDSNENNADKTEVSNKVEQSDKKLLDKSVKDAEKSSDSNGNNANKPDASNKVEQSEEDATKNSKSEANKDGTGVEVKSETVSKIDEAFSEEDEKTKESNNGDKMETSDNDKDSEISSIKEKVKEEISLNEKGKEESQSQTNDKSGEEDMDTSDNKDEQSSTAKSNVDDQVSNKEEGIKDINDSVKKGKEMCNNDNKEDQSPKTVDEMMKESDVTCDKEEENDCPKTIEEMERESKKKQDSEKDNNKDSTDKLDNTVTNSETEHNDKEKSKEGSDIESSQKEKDSKDSTTIKSPEPKRVTYNGHIVKTLNEIQSELRKQFWISDGGFTELHAVWNHEESLLIPGQEWEMWHRRHDFWLLTGVITHGYRHWQDIMNDPRFEILNKAFRFDADRLKRAAFLNRRFQLLEQALVIEEQLRKAALENSSHFQAAVEEVIESQGKDASNDLLTQVDQFAANLRKISHGMKVSGPPPDAKVHKAISTLSGLITDIRQITYKTMPSTLAMTDHGAQSAKLSMLAKQMQKEAAAVKIITVD